MWQKTEGGLYNQYSFKDFNEAFSFMTNVAEVAEAQNHHPRWQNEWNNVQIWLSTHSEGGKITEKDHLLAKIIDKLAQSKLNKSTTSKGLKIEQVKLFTDGGSRGNPGPSASGFVILTMDDKVILEKGIYLGVTTNNQAEYTALKLGLEEIHRLGVHNVEVYMDSLLVVNQMKGIFKIRNRDLWPIHEAIKRLEAQFKHISFQHVPRELNKLADAAVNQALDKELGLTPSL
ncbi:MAG TPA: 4a-hydroxytetrahydrobiopterin dehydratase [Candidatus Dormibacteraeota bacterium]|nr:4a-hydroxytetrahydrobiopterin dehydratase [Candidatus Dormibacteraeota bacterium]